MRKLSAALAGLVLLALPNASAALGATPLQQLTAKLQWRSIGPYVGGRAVAVAGIASQPNVSYMGAVEGGIWRSDDYGQNWTNVSDGKLPGIASSIGALAVFQANPKIVYAGTGESDIRSDFDTGDGVYKSSDGGKTWKYAGLRDTHMTADMAIDPRDSNVVYVASMGHVFKPNATRGIFKTTDGGKSWRKVLYVDDKTGGVSLAMDPRDPRVVYAAMWQAQRVPWKLTSGGPGSGLYKTTDGGAHWSKISNHPGFAGGVLGKIGVAVAASDPRVVYAIVQARDGGVFRSDDAGATWKHVNDEMKLRQRAFYYTTIYVDPTDSKVAYAPQVDDVFRTKDGGKTWAGTNAPHGDNHIVWINPRNPKILLVGNDGGATVTVDGGEHWSSWYNQPTGQYYHVAIDDQFPFHVFGAAQDEGAFEGPSAALGGIGPGEWHVVALGESTFVAPEPASPFVTYGSGYYSSFVRFDRITGNEKNVSPWPRYMSGAPASEMKYRFGWTHPIFFSPADPRELLLAAQVVFSSLDHGRTWSVISPDLTRNDPSTEGPSGGPVSLDETGAETFPDIASLAVSPLDANVLWAGSADGLVHVTRDHGAHWSAVTPPQLPQWAQISSIEPSHADKGTAYLTASRYMWDDFHPYVYATSDYGAHWRTIVAGLPENQYVFVVRQDPREPRLLFAGTRSTVYASLDGGAKWQPLTLNLPGVQVRDLAIDAREGELVAATHGRAFWILDNLALLEQLAREPALPSATFALFSPENAWLTHSYGNGGFPVPNSGENPQYGATVFFNLPQSYDGKTPLTLSFTGAADTTIRTFHLHLLAKTDRPATDEQEERLDATAVRAIDLRYQTGVKPGINAFVWDLRSPPAFDVPGFRPLPTDDWPDTADGPTVVPGAYTVTLQYGNAKLQAPLTVQLDPRMHPAAGDLDARLALETQIFDTIDGLDRAIAAAMSARAGLTAAQRARVDAEIANLVMLDVHSSESDTMHPTKIREQLGFLLNSLEGAYDRPTAAEYAAYADLKALAEAGEAKLKTASR